MILRNIVLGVSIAAGVCGLGGCQSNVPGGLPDTAQIEDSYFYGSWVSADGKKNLEVKPGPYKSFKLAVSDATGTREYTGHLVRVDQSPFAELCMYTPREKDSKMVPVYLYEHVKIEPNQFTTRAMRTAWMSEAVKQIEGAKYVPVPQGATAGGGVVVRDPAMMQTLLRRALNEPGSFEAEEVYKRKQ